MAQRTQRTRAELEPALCTHMWSQEAVASVFIPHLSSPILVASVLIKFLPQLLRNLFWVVWYPIPIRDISSVRCVGGVDPAVFHHGRCHVLNSHADYWTVGALDHMVVGIEVPSKVIGYCASHLGWEFRAKYIESIALNSGIFVLIN